jgi:cytochrome c-type biogenesis protein
MNSLLEGLSNLIQNSLWFAPFVALFAGILTAFSPCSLSGVPLVIGYVGGADSKEPKKALKLSLIFALGSALTYTTLGVVAAIFGKFIGFAGNWWFLVLSGILILMVLQLWEIIDILPKNNLLRKNKRRGYIGAFFAGILAGLFCSPCATPVLIVLLAIVSSKGSLLLGVILLLLYSIGHSVLVIAAGTSIGFVNQVNQSKKYKTIGNIVRIIFGLLILVLAFYMFYLGI